MNSIPSKLNAWAALQKGGKLQKFQHELRALQPQEILIRVSACGVCHSDLHLVDDDWLISHFPLVPGHEIMGSVVARGGLVQHLNIGDVVGVGWQRSCCGVCEDCISGRDHLCRIDRKKTCVDHFGGYADFHITDGFYAFKIPPELQKPEAAPLFCAGATVFNPLKVYGKRSVLSPVRVGIVGLGGLGHLAVKMANLMGYEVTLFSSSPNKKIGAEQMGAHHIVSSTDPNIISALGARLDLILVTVNVDLPWSAYLSALRSDGTLCFVGVPPKNLNFHVAEILDAQRHIAGSVIGSHSQITEMLEFCALKNILPTTELFPMNAVNDAIEKVRSNKIRYRAVLVSE